jgi:hypothetical protein
MTALLLACLWLQPPPPGPVIWIVYPTVRVC